MTAADRPGGARVRARGWGWRHAGRSTQAVRDLDLDIAPGERVLLLGSSGAGKSTLLHALAGILGGEEEGDEFGELTLDGAHPAERRGVAGLVLQDPDTQAVLARVGDDVAFACENLGVAREQIWPRVHDALADVGLDVPLDRSTSALSGGQKQRLALAGVLAMRPRLLLLDEPTANLDPAGVIEVRDAVARVLERTGASFVVIEHRVDVWIDLVDRVVVLDRDGGVLADGSPSSVLTEARSALEDAGVWLPDAAPVARVGAAAEPRGVALESIGLAVGHRRFGKRAADVVASGLDARFLAGNVTAITGPNGIGKSTFALTLAGLLPPAGGEVRASDALRAGIGAEPIRWNSSQLLARIATVFQEPEHQFLTPRVRDELLLGPRRLGWPEQDAIAAAERMLHELRLERLADANPFTLSGGEKRRLSVAAALVAGPSVIVLDEPTFGQDRRTWAVLVELLAQLRDRGRAIIAVSHDRAFIEALADHEHVMDAGREVLR
ncbi:ABC transporter ATP-binding protein [Microbacteriaceae bacterium VKM Ac-2854]|nr:ABC transporter ATP-binding protein [Microbacteriaceae bacterium VKM Ac-2854]